MLYEVITLLARDKVRATGEMTRFRGFDMGKVDYRRREFVCKGCSNFCDMQEIRIGGANTYWGDKCSERYRKGARTDIKPVIEDLPARRVITSYSIHYTKLYESLLGK